jgi:p-hydroxybenzoate 3-monooxygenase
MRRSRTQVAIVGAGPAGLTLAQLLHRAGIESVVLEDRSRAYVEARIRAGVLEQGTVELLERAGVAERLHREGIVHHGIHLQFAGERHHMPLTELSGGRSIVIYGQTEVVKDLIGTRLEADLPLLFEVSDVGVHAFDGDAPFVTFTHDGEEQRLDCDVIAGCDGFHGVCRPDEDIAEWPDERIWEELALRTALDGWSLQEGPVLEKGITGMRSFVVEPMQRGRLFLAGDAAHIVPPTGAKGLNLAAHDVRVLADALVDWFASGSTTGLDGYSAECLRRVWRAEHFSWWMTSMLHRPPDADEFDEQLQLSQLRYLTTSTAAATTLAENYVGLERV